MKNFIKNIDVTVYKGIIVGKTTKLNYSHKDEKREIKQKLENLVFTQIEKRKADNFETENKTIIYLKEGMVVLFENEIRGYVVPVERYVTISEAREDLECIKDLDKEE